MTKTMQRFQLFGAIILTTVALAITTLSGCIGRSSQEVVVLCALDKEFSESILNEFTAETGVTVLPKFDWESNKTVGLATLIINQKEQTKADVFWNNEILHSLRLKKLGLLEAYPTPLAEQYPENYVSKDSDWHGFAARARVLIVNTDLIPEGERPDSIDDMIDPKWKGKCAVARPLFGTTATQAAVMFADWGEEKAKAYLTALAANAVVESGNKQVAVKVAKGEHAFGLTDTDDAIIELERGAPVAIIFPDQIAREGEAEPRGTLFIPNTLCIIKDGPNFENAKKLVDHLLNAKIEEQLAAGPSAQIPLNKNAKVKSRVEPADGIRMSKANFEKAAEVWPEAQMWLKKTFPFGM